MSVISNHCDSHTQWTGSPYTRPSFLALWRMAWMGRPWAGRSLKIRRLVPTVPLQLSPALLVRLAGLQSGSKLERSGDREA